MVANPVRVKKPTDFGDTSGKERLPYVPTISTDPGDVPTLGLHGDADATVPFGGSGRRTQAAIPHSELHVIAGGPHGINVNHREELDRLLVDFLGR